MTTLSSIELSLFFTQDVSLATWDEVGMLDREVALYRALQSHLKTIEFVTYGDSTDARFAERLNGIQLTFNRLGLPEKWYTRWLQWLAPLSDKEPSIYKSNQMLGADVALKAARRRGARFIARCGYLHSHNTEKEHGVDSVKAQQARELEEQVFGAADRIVVTTEGIRQQIMERYGIFEKQITVIPNYVLTDEFAPGRDNAFKSQRICFIGRLSFEKNVDMLIDALVGLDVELCVVGDGALRSELEQQVQSKNVNVDFVGNVKHTELPELLRSCAMFVLPSQYEGHPKALLEAMSCGLPVVGTDVSGIREVIQHRENGYLAEPSVEGLREAILDIANDEVLRQNISVGARDYVLENVSLEKIVTLELALLESLL